MHTFEIRIPAAVAAALALMACGEKTPTSAEPRPAPQAQPAPAVPAPPMAPPAVATPTTAPAAVPAPPTAPPAVATPPTAPPAAPAPASEARATAPGAPASPPPVPTAKPAPAHPKVGADKCKMCHRVQHQSWAASPHAAKGLDCEACHGNGGDYWPASVMRDRAKAEAAGLVVPTLASCKRCHGAKADATLFGKVHAHKAK